jgi:hypothetical protein
MNSIQKKKIIEKIAKKKENIIDWIPETMLMRVSSRTS